jgi:hypothetical protein
MKVSKIPGCGSFGVFIDDVDFDTMSDEEWMEIGKIHLKELVTIIRNTNLNKKKYIHWMKKWGKDRMTFEGMLRQKYPDWDGKTNSVLDQVGWDRDDINAVLYFSKIVEHDVLEEQKSKVLRVCGGYDQEGDPIGMFSEGELLWHSNESGNIVFSPGVALLAYQNTTKSSTGFLTTVDYYESVSDSFRSELDEMILIHNFTEGKINPGLNNYQDNLMYKNMAPDPDAEIPMVIRSPYGHIGLHYSFNTVTGIKGMSKEEGDKLLSRIRKELEVEEYIYDHWYQQDGDLCLFDNSVTQHRRLGQTQGRLCYRYQYDYNNLQDGPWMPYLQQPYINSYIDKINNIISNHMTENDEFKLPKKEDYA